MPIFDISPILVAMRQNCANAGLQVEEVSLPTDPPQRFSLPPPVITLTLGGESLPVSESMGQDDVWRYTLALSCWISPYSDGDPLSGDAGAIKTLSKAYDACQQTAGELNIRVETERLSAPERVGEDEAAMDVVRLIMQMDVQPD